jgi:hypothetical protein
LSLEGLQLSDSLVPVVPVTVNPVGADGGVVSGGGVVVVVVVVVGVVEVLVVEPLLVEVDEAPALIEFSVLS